VAFVAASPSPSPTSSPTTSSPTTRKNEYHAAALIAWLQTNGGHIHPDLEMRRADPSDPDSRIGMFATDAIAADSLLLRIPTSIMIHEGSSHDDDDDDNDGTDNNNNDDDTLLACKTVRNLAKELKRKDQSSYAPYVNYLLDNLPNQTPSAWSASGQDLLNDVLQPKNSNTGSDSDSDSDSNRDLPPDYPTDWIADDWTNGCNGGRSGNPTETLAALFVVQKAIGVLWNQYQSGTGTGTGTGTGKKGPTYTGTMIPIYDMIQHKNTSARNAAIRNNDPQKEEEPSSSSSSSSASTVSVTVVAVKDIPKGQEIYAPSCHKEHLAEENGFGFYGTPDVFRDCGIVEDYPQTWYFQGGVDRAFRIDYRRRAETETETETENKNGSDEELTSSMFAVTGWIGGGSGNGNGNGGEPSKQDLKNLKRLLDQVLESKETMLSTRPNADNPTVPQHEWDAIRAYISAMEIAIATALHYDYDNDCIDSGTCSISSFEERYVDLQHQNLVFLYDDGEDDPPTCDDEVQTEPFHDGTFETLEEIQSPYQNLVYMWNPENRDTCLDLDGTIQICDSYRPHYHELSVHNAARYLQKPKRFLWVGGGDSMLLHEFLKYPDLELAVGLELDQRVPRSSFQHFGAQPHFDNDKVEWWFGDATKSLMMLPKDYFGSFDMVVVDLSETVMSFKVTEGLDVIEALTLLLKPDGIFVKNEIYFGKFKNMFPQSVQIHWYVRTYGCVYVCLFACLFCVCFVKLICILGI
jgi:spermidine synthase